MHHKSPLDRIPTSVVSKQTSIYLKIFKILIPLACSATEFLTLRVYNQAFGPRVEDIYFKIRSSLPQNNRWNHVSGVTLKFQHIY